MYNRWTLSLSREFSSSVPVNCWRDWLTSCLGIPEFPIVFFFFALACKLEPVLLLILGFKVCCCPGQQEENGDTNSLFILPWRQSLRLPLVEHCPFPSPQNWRKSWSAIFTSRLSGSLDQRDCVFQWPNRKGKCQWSGNTLSQLIQWFACSPVLKPWCHSTFDARVTSQVTDAYGLPGLPALLLAAVQCKHMLYW